MTESKNKHRLQWPPDIRKKNAEFCDLFMSVDGVEFDLHRIIMAHSMRDYIQVHARTGIRMDGAGNTPTNRILVENFVGGASVFEDIVKYCYGESSFAVTDSNFSGLYYAERYFQMSREEEQQSLYAHIHAYFSDNQVDLRQLGFLWFEALQVEHKYEYPKDLSTEIMALARSQMKSMMAGSNPFPLIGLLCDWLEHWPLNLQFAKDFEAALSVGFDENTKSKIVTKLILCAHRQKKCKYTDDEGRTNSLAEEEESELKEENCQAAEGESKFEEAIAHLMKTGLHFESLSSEDVIKLLLLSKQCFQLFEHRQLGFVRSFLEAKMSLGEKIPLDLIMGLYLSRGQSFSAMCENDEERRVCLSIVDMVARSALEPSKLDNHNKLLMKEDVFFDPQAFLGCKIKVCWGNGKWYPGEIDGYDQATGQHHVTYTDGDKGIYDLAKRTWDFL